MLFILLRFESCLSKDPVQSCIERYLFCSVDVLVAHLIYQAKG